MVIACQSLDAGNDGEQLGGNRGLTAQDVDGAAVFQVGSDVGVDFCLEAGGGQQDGGVFSY